MVLLVFALLPNLALLACAENLQTGENGDNPAGDETGLGETLSDDNGEYGTEREIHYIGQDGAQHLLGDSFYTLTSDAEELSSGWYIVSDKLDFGSTRLNINGDVKLILMDECGITTTGGIHVGGFLLGRKKRPTCTTAA